VSQNGSRDVPVAEFMVGPKKNARHQNEIILGVTLPAMNGRQGYAKVGVRNAMVISVALQDGTPRGALGSVGPTVLRCPQAEAFLSAHLDANGVVSDDAAKEFGRLVSQESKPIDDHRSTAAYRRHAVGVLAQRLSQRGDHS
jgi:CO/xanthine dehydrogenase FAD-binding subunit